jgi:hypothetical protein
MTGVVHAGRRHTGLVGGACQGLAKHLRIAAQQPRQIADDLPARCRHVVEDQSSFCRCDDRSRRLEVPQQKRSSLDSPLEEAVKSEPVSEMVIPGEFWRLRAKIPCCKTSINDAYGA